MTLDCWADGAVLAQNFTNPMQAIPTSEEYPKPFFGMESSRVVFTCVMCVYYVTVSSEKAKAISTTSL